MAKISKFNNFGTKNPVTLIFAVKEDAYDMNIYLKNHFFDMCGFEVI